MHILIIPSERLLPVDDPIAGIFQYHQAMALHRAGVNVGVIAPMPLFGRKLWARISRLRFGYTTDNRFPFPTITNQGSVLWPGRFTRGTQILFDRIGCRLYDRYVAVYGIPDLIHAHNVVHAGCFSIKLSDKFHIPYVITEHSSNFLNGSMRITKRIKAAYRHASARLMVSPFLGKIVESSVGYEVTPWEWVPNILPPDFEQKNAKRKILKERFRFLCIAQFTPVKNHVCLLRAFASSFRGRNAELVLGGDGPLFSATKQIANRLGILSQVSFLGSLSRNQVFAEMERCDVVVLPSHHETFGVVLIEALSCGRPVIAPCGSGPDAIVTEDTGTLFHPDDPNDLATAMKNIYTNHDRYDPKFIRDSCLSRYGEKAVISQLINLYNRALKDQCHQKKENRAKSINE